MSTVQINKSSEIASDSLLIAGIQKHLASASVFVNGTSYTGPDLVKLVQARIDAVNVTIANRAAWQAAVKAEAQELLQSRPFLNALRKAIFTMFSDIESLADFGLTPHKKPVITPAERVARAAKAKATRAARHTMGSKQKEAITGTVSPVASPSPASPPTVAAPAAPVASPAAQTSGSVTPKA